MANSAFVFYFLSFFKCFYVSFITFFGLFFVFLTHSGGGKWGVENPVTPRPQTSGSPILPSGSPCLTIYIYIQDVPGGMCQNSGGCFLC